MTGHPWPRGSHGPTSPSSCSPQALQGYGDGPQCFTRLEMAPGSPPHYLVRSVKGQGEISIDTLDPGSRQIAVEEGRDGLAGLRDLVVAVIITQIIDNRTADSFYPLHLLTATGYTSTYTVYLYLGKLRTLKLTNIAVCSI